MGVATRYSVPGTMRFFSPTGGHGLFGEHTERHLFSQGGRPETVCAECAAPHILAYIRKHMEEGRITWLSKSISTGAQPGQSQRRLRRERTARAGHRLPHRAAAGGTFACGRALCGASVASHRLDSAGNQQRHQSGGSRKRRQQLGGGLLCQPAHQRLGQFRRQRNRDARLFPRHAWLRLGAGDPEERGRCHRTARPGSQAPSGAVCPAQDADAGGSCRAWLHHQSRRCRVAVRFARAVCGRLIPRYHVLHARPHYITQAGGCQQPPADFSRVTHTRLRRGIHFREPPIVRGTSAGKERFL